MAIKIWDLATGTVHHTLRGHSDGVRGVAFSPDGRLVVELHRKLEGHLSWARDVAFSPDGRLVASASYDRTIRLWDSAMRVLK
jgi:WD40 repeat protein